MEEEQARRKQLSFLKLAQGELLKKLGTESIIAPYTPTPQEILDKLLEFAKVNKDDFIIDVGCGDGRLLCAAAERFGTRGYGCDIEVVAIEDAKKLIQKKKLEDLISVEVRDIFEQDSKVDWASATVVILYLSIQGNLKVRPILLKNLKQGTKVVTVQFGMGSWKPTETCQVEHPGHHSDTGKIPLYLYTINEEAIELLNSSSNDLDDWTLNVTKNQDN